MSEGPSLLAVRLTVTFLVQVTLISAQLEVNQDPCANFACKWGGMCQVDSFGFPECFCPVSCPYSTTTVCSTYGVEFPSECEMHRFACTHTTSISVKNRGKCNGSISEMCPSRNELVQFRDRYMEWVYIYKGFKADPSFKPEKRVYELSISEKINAVKWVFGVYDHDKNGVLDDDEIKALLNKVMVHESCGHGFIKSCTMVDKNPNINEEEWTICFNLADRPFERQH